MFRKIAVSVFLFSAIAVSAGAQESGIGPRDTRRDLYELYAQGRSVKELQPEYRAGLFAELLAKLSPQERAVSFRNMVYLQAKADRLRERRQYSEASTRYYEAALYIPRALLLLKSAEARLEDDLTRQHLYPIDIRFLLDDSYQLAVEFSRYERPEERSLSGACLDAVKRKIACLQSLCRELRDTPLNMEDVRQCHALAPDIFRYERVCK